MVIALSAFGLAIALAMLVLLLSRRQALAGDVWLQAWIGSNIVLFAGMGAASAATGLAALAGALSVQLAVSVMAPALYLFAWSITRGRPPANRLWIAALPAAAAALFLVALAFLPVQIEQGRILLANAPRWITVLPVLTILGHGAFPLAALKRLRDHRTGLGRPPARALQSDLAWVRIWAGAHLSLLGLLLAGFLATVPGWLGADAHLALILTGQAGLIAYVGFRAVTRSHVFFASDTPVWRAARLKPERQRAEIDLQVIKQRLADPEVHTDPALSAARFADQLGWDPARVNEAIRAGGATSFTHLLTTARVGTVKRWALCEDHAGIALLTLGLDAGFGSKSAFYDAFKAVEGVSPGAWRRAQTAQAAKSR